MEESKCKIVVEVMEGMQKHLTGEQLLLLQKVMIECLSKGLEESKAPDNRILLKSFIKAKEMEGLSPLTTKKYRESVEKLIERNGDKSLTEVTTEDLRSLIDELMKEKHWAKTTADTFRRQLSSFYGYLVEEGWAIRNPVSRIHKIRSEKKVKQVHSDEELEKMRSACTTLRDIAIVDFLSSSGVRVSELVSLDIADLDMEKRECIISGKGKKERTVYFDARTKVSLASYIASRNDSSPALFVSQKAPHGRITPRTVERCISQIGRKAETGRSFPHKFRASMATKSLDKGMPVEHLQQILGHASVDTTLNYYALVRSENVKSSHRRYVG